MKKFFIIFALLLGAPALVFGAIASVGTLGSGGTTTAGTNITITTSATLNQHNIVLVRIGADNFGSSDGFTSEVTSVTDSAGNTYEKLCEYTYAEGGAANGAMTALWVARAATQLTSGGTISVTLANSVGSKVAQAQELTVTSGNKLQIAGTCQTENFSGVDAGSIVISGLPSKEYYFVRALAWESTGGTITTLTTNYSVIPPVSVTTGSGPTSMTSAAERRIVTATGETSDPTLSAVGSGDGASIFLALEECTPGTNCTGDTPPAVSRRPPVIVQ